MNVSRVALLCALIVAVSFTTVTAQPQAPSESEVLVTQAPDPGSDGRSWTQIEIVLSVAILMLALVITVIHAIVMVKLDNIDWTPLSILRFNGLTLIISGGLMLVTAGYSNEQIAPVSGLLGALAGYLLGDRTGGPAT